MNKNEIKIRIIIVGGEYTGKSTFIKYIYDENLEKSEYEMYQMTHNLSLLTKKFIYKNRIFSIDIFDTPGIEKYRRLLGIIMKDSDVILFFYDPFDKESFEIVNELLNMSKEYCECNPILVLICNKYDLNMDKKAKNIIKDEEVLEYAEKNKLLFSHLSIFDKCENGINELFTKIFDKYIENMTNI